MCVAFYIVIMFQKYFTVCKYVTPPTKMKVLTIQMRVGTILFVYFLKERVTKK